MAKSVYILGLESLNRKLTNLSNTNLAEDILEEACLMVEKDAKILCPVDDGTLRNSITHEVDGQKGVVGSNVEYAVYVHQGTGIYAVHGDGRQDRWKYQDDAGEWHSTIGQQPNPFLENALLQNEANINKLVKKRVEEAVR